MDDDKGTGIPGEDNAAAEQAAGQRPPGPKPAVRARKTAHRPPRKAAQAATAGGGPAQAPSGGTGKAGTAKADAPAVADAPGDAPGAEVAPVVGELTEGQESAPEVAAGPNGAPEQARPSAPPAGKAEAAPAAAKKAAPGRPGVKTPAGRKPPAVAAKKAAPAGRAKPAAQGQKAAAVKSTKSAKSAQGTKAAAPAAKAARAAGAAGVTKAAGPRAAGPGAVPVPAAAPEGAPWQVPDYLAEQDLGTGASGRSVRARHEPTGTPVAITYLSAALTEDSSFREAYPGEAGLLRGVDSPYVARFYGYVEEGPHAAVVREPVDGVGLDALLREKGATGPEAALSVLKGSLLGLAAAHEAGVVHRGYQPANVLVGTEGAVKLVDFGLVVRGAKSGTSADAHPYTAPEQSAGGPATVAGDLYAATAVLSACLTGTTPDAGVIATEPAIQDSGEPIAEEPIAEEPISKEPIAYGQVPEPVQPLLSRGLAANPAERPQSAADFAAELEAVAVAAYGADWEERGQRELAALVGLLLSASEEGAAGAVPPAPVVLAASGKGAGSAYSPAGSGPTGNGPTGDAPVGAPRFGRRAKILAIAVAGVILAGVVAVTAVASGDKDENTAAVAPTPTAVTTSPSSAPTSAATTAAPTTSPSASPTATVPATTTPSLTPSAGRSATPKGSPATTRATAPTSPSASPSRTTGSAAGPHVSSVGVTGFQCTTGSHRKATATVSVQYDGTAAGTLHLTWWKSATGKPQGAVTMPPQTARFPKGSRSYTFTDNFTFTPDPAHPYVGITVSTDPAAASGNGSIGVGCH